MTKERSGRHKTGLSVSPPPVTNQGEEMKIKERTTTRPFRSKYPGRCPLGPEGVHPICVGDLVVKVSPGFSWNEESYGLVTGRGIYHVIKRTEYVHKECFDGTK